MLGVGNQCQPQLKAASTAWLIVMKPKAASSESQNGRNEVSVCTEHSGGKLLIQARKEWEECFTNSELP